MERIKLSLFGTILLQGRAFDHDIYVDGAPRTEVLLLVETEEQYILQVGDRVVACANYDFDYRGLVDELSEIFKNGAVVDFMAWEFMDTVEAWADVDCDTSILDEEVRTYFKKLGE